MMRRSIVRRMRRLSRGSSDVMDSVVAGTIVPEEEVEDDTSNNNNNIATVTDNNGLISNPNDSLGHEASHPMAVFRNGMLHHGSKSSIIKLMDRVHSFAQDSTFNLSMRAPSLLHLMIALKTFVGNIFIQNEVPELNNHTYFLSFLTALERQCKTIITMFEVTASEMEDPTSAQRADLMKRTLIINHLNNEINALYDYGLWKDYSDIQLEAPRIFWERYFSLNAQGVPKREFMEKLKTVLQFTCEEEIQRFQAGIDMCEDDFITWWEWDVFTRLFQPWDRILNTWNVIVTKHPGYRAWSTYEEVRESLGAYLDKPGSYVFRLSVTRPGDWAIGFVSRNRVLQAIPEGKSLYQALIDGANDGSYLYPNGQDENVDVRRFTEVQRTDHIVVTEEQNAIYARVDTKFETCKICLTNEKDYKIEPCGHLMCQSCFDGWAQSQESGRAATCPFCRSAIQHSGPVVIQPFQQSDSGAAQAAEASATAETYINQNDKIRDVTDEEDIEDARINLEDLALPSNAPADFWEPVVPNRPSSSEEHSRSLDNLHDMLVEDEDEGEEPPPLPPRRSHGRISSDIRQNRSLSLNLEANYNMPGINFAMDDLNTDILEDGANEEFETVVSSTRIRESIPMEAPNNGPEIVDSSGAPQRVHLENDDEIHRQTTGNTVNDNDDQDQLRVAAEDDGEAQMTMQQEPSTGAIFLMPTSDEELVAVDQMDLALHVLERIHFNYDSDEDTATIQAEIISRSHDALNNATAMSRQIMSKICAIEDTVQEMEKSLHMNSETKLGDLGQLLQSTTVDENEDDNSSLREPEQHPHVEVLPVTLSDNDDDDEGEVDEEESLPELNLSEDDNPENSTC